MPDHQSNIVFSVITPTYNRAQTLPRVYGSLLQQSFRVFEWIVIDDGSIDNTELQVASWRKQATFPIVYAKQENAGKPSAVNKGIAMATGEFILILDSDDACTPDAMENMLNAWQQIPENKRADFVGVTGLCEDQFAALVGEKFPRDVLDSDTLEMMYHYKTKGEKWGFLRADVLRKIPQPVAKGFIPESIWWNTIAKQYKTRYINEVVRIYYVDEAETGQLSTVTDPFKHAKGHAFWHQWVLNEEIPWFWQAPMVFIRSGVHYLRFSLMVQISLSEQYKGLNNLGAKLLWLIALPVSLLVYFRDCYQRKIRRHR